MAATILLSNDDGWDAPGLRALAEQLAAFAEVTVCAPLFNQSACSHSLTLHDVLRLKKHRERVFSVSGTPADCVYVALNANGGVLSREPDLVVSGLNAGANLGVDVLYSGTVAAAREAAIRGVPAVAFSTDFNADHHVVAAQAGRLVASLLQSLANLKTAAAQRRATPEVALLNVNIPTQLRGPTRVTRLGRRAYDDEVVFRTDPRGRDYLWIGSGAPTADCPDEADTDIHTFMSGCISVTPLSLDLTAYDQRELARQVIDQSR